VIRGNASSAYDPTNLPGDLGGSQSVMAINTEKGPYLVAFTANHVKALLPPGAPPGVTEQQLPALEVATIAGKEPYFGLIIDPGSENSLAIPGDFLRAGLPSGKTNARAKAVLAILNRGNTNDPSIREALVAAVAEGPMYTAINKAALDEKGQPEFPVIPIQAGPDGLPVSGGEAAIVFGTSPAEIAAAFDLKQWVPAPVRVNDVVTAVRRSANLKLAVIDPQGPTLQIPIADQEFKTNVADLLNEPTPEPGESTEPDGGTREGED
jgi:hypothetical protein